MHMFVDLEDKKQVLTQGFDGAHYCVDSSAGR